MVAEQGADAKHEDKIESIDLKDDKAESSKDGATKGKKKKEEKPPGVPMSALWRYSESKDKILAFLAGFFSLGAGALQPIVLIVLGDVLNNFSGSTIFFSLSPQEVADMINASGVDILAGVMPTIYKFIYFGIAILVSSYGAQSLWVYTSEKITRTIRVRYVTAILRQDVGWHDKAEEGSLTTRLALDTQLIQDGIGEKFGIALQSFASFVGGFVVAFIKGWKLALVMFACMPILIAVGVSLGMQIKKFTQASSDVYAKAGAIAEQAISGIRTVTSFSLQNRFVEQYDTKLIDAEKSDIRKGQRFALGVGVFMFTLYGILGLAFWYSSRLVIDGTMNGGDVMVVFFGMLIGAMSLMGIPTNLQAVTTAQGAAYKVYNVIERVPTIDSANPGGLKPERLEGNIEFKNARFNYPSRPDVIVLHDLSLLIKPGQTVAFVGPSGSGKSTSVSLVQRFYDVLSGQVLIDGKDVKDYNVHWLREHVGLVGQEPVLFNMSIKENILMGTATSITEERLIEVCKMANCHNFISMLPNGYETQVGEHGGMLSGGQKQRIAIARALIKNPQILLLDEATSALDTASERIVQKALDVASKNRTTITIAHRLSTIRYADLICVMDKGVLVEQGTHDQLIDLGGVYKSLVDKQRIAMKEDNPAETTEGEAEVEVFNVPNQDAMLAQRPQTSEVAISVKSADGMLSLPSGAEMTQMAGLRRKNQKKDEKARQKELPKFSYRRIIRYVSNNGGYLSLGVLGGLMAGAASPLFAYLLAKVVITFLNPDKDTISPGPMSGANLYAFMFAILGLGGFIGFGLQIAAFEKVGAHLTRILRRLTFRSLLRQEVGFFDMPGHSLGALTSRLATDAAHVNDMVGKAWGDVAQFVATVVTGLTIALIAAPALTGVMLTLAPFAIYASYYQTKGMKGFEDESRAAYEEASETAAEAIKEIRTVSALTREAWFVDKYNSSLDHPAKLGRKKAFVDSFAYALQGSVGQFSSALAFYAGIKFMLQGMFGFSDLFVCLMTVMITSQAVGRSTTFMSNLDKGKIAAINTFELLDRESKIDPEADGVVPEGEFNPDFSFENIAFTYPARPQHPIFTGEFSVSGKKNQTLALVGPSGCGKSTTIGMLQRWYDVVDGKVTVGEHDVKSYQLKKGLRKHIALVGQEPVLFDMSIRENIMWGSDDENVSQADVEQAAQLANIHNFIVSLPDSYNTRVGDKGSQLSGGQKQRIAIARALIRKPKILLLDEATSALDSESEKVVQEAIDKASEGRTTVTIAHRLSTIQNADQIAVVSGGRVVEKGRHFELLALNGVYADLVKQQDLGHT